MTTRSDSIEQPQSPEADVTLKTWLFQLYLSKQALALACSGPGNNKEVDESTLLLKLNVIVGETPSLAHVTLGDRQKELIEEVLHGFASSEANIDLEGARLVLDIVTYLQGLAVLQRGSVPTKRIVQAITDETKNAVDEIQ
jgi:hypothetical protein